MSKTREIATEVRALSQHYPRRQLSTSDFERWLSDYVEDLSGCDPADVRRVCAQWRASTATQMPTPGQLLAKCRALVHPERIALAPPPSSPRVSPDERKRVGEMVRDWLKGRELR